MRTFSRDHWDEAQAQWRDGDFSDEWKPFRHQAAMRGMLYPPEGSQWDSWGDDQPSQRAILVRAIRETPALLTKLVDQSSSWGQVVGKLLYTLNEEVGPDVLDNERRDRARREDDPDHKQAVMALADILGRLEASR